MTTLRQPQARHSRLGEILVWSFAAVVMLSAHAGLAALLLLEPVPTAAQDAPPAAIMIEMAALPESVDTTENVINPDTAEAEDIKSDTVEPVEEVTDVPPPPEPQPEPEPIPEPVVEETPPEPVEEVAEPLPEELPEPIEEIDPIQQEMVAALENVEVPLPVSRPPPPVEKKAEVKKVEDKKKKPDTQPKKPPPASKSSQMAKVDATESNRTAAQKTSVGSSSSSVSPARWQNRVMAHLERRKRYPSDARSRKEQGTAYVRFQIDEGGNVLSVSLSRSSGSAALDEEVVSMVRRASPVPAPPPGVSKTIVAPVQFTIR
ncbi:TonB family protein [Agrobacterium sp.]|uniref:energy transducer TonB family protein n=1 Tax=Agrobacterium sp. TaxID=361 RepID=UPI0028A88A5C